MQKTVIMDFSGAYQEEDFFQDKQYIWLDFRNLEGVNCYCTEEAEAAVKESIKDLDSGGIHFLDSGNYHYLSKIWLDKIQEPFVLINFDNHTDMQEAAFFGLLSCGSWVREALYAQNKLQRVCIVGPCAGDLEECGEEKEKITGIEKEELFLQGDRLLEAFLEENRDLPVYLSIDKDILRIEDARTNWNQGQVSLDRLGQWIRMVFKRCRVIGADICGEISKETALPLQTEDAEINSRTNRILWDLLEEEFQKQEKER